MKINYTQLVIILIIISSSSYAYSAVEDINIIGPSSILEGGSASYSIEVLENGSWRSFNTSNGGGGGGDCGSTATACVSWSISTNAFGTVSPTHRTEMPFVISVDSTSTITSFTITSQYTNGTSIFSSPFNVNITSASEPQNSINLHWLPAVIGLVLN